MANEKIMNNVTNVLEPPLKVGSGTSVAENCDIQQTTAVINDGEPSNLRSGTPEQQRVPTVLLKPKKTSKNSNF